MTSTLNHIHVYKGQEISLSRPYLKPTPHRYGWKTYWIVYTNEV